MINEQKRSIAISIRISPEELKMLENLTEVKHQTKTAVIISALTMYAQSLTAASPAPEEISPETVTGATETQARTPTETEAETPEENQQGKPQDAHSKPQDNGNASKADITSKASATPTEDAENATEASTSPSPEEIAEEIKAAYLKGYKQARQEIKAAQQAAQQAQRIRRTAQRARVLTQARRRPKAYKG